MAEGARAVLGPLANAIVSGMSNMIQYGAPIPIPVMPAGAPTQAVTAPSQPVAALPPTVTYPEIYYRLMPYVLTIRDQLASAGVKPAQEALERISDAIYDDICRRDPDMRDYLSGAAAKDPPGDPPARGGFFQGRQTFGGFRRRGIGRDFIDALLLAELFQNRYYPYASPYPYPSPPPYAPQYPAPSPYAGYPMY